MSIEVPIERVPNGLLRKGHNALEAVRPTQVGKLWHWIDWEKAMRIVRKLQARIVQAVKATNWRKVRALQRLLARSTSAKLLAIRQVTTNKGAKTAGIDGKVWDSPSKKWKAKDSLDSKGYQAQAVRVIKIPKKNGKQRKLGIPTMRDRAMQALYLQTLDPVSETLADHHSYGFRRYRSCADAIRQCHTVLYRKQSAEWILEADIKGCFDHISHEWLMQNIPLPNAILQQWLQSGQQFKGQYFPTPEGTPQGAIISPTLANITLDGLQAHLDQAFNIKRKVGGGYANPHRLHFIRYADDFIITAKDRTVLIDRVLPLVRAFLKDRGLELSETKTRISSIHEGFDFLGKHLRKYNGKLLIKPSKSSIKTFLSDIRSIIRRYPTITAAHLIVLLNPKIRGWAMYYRHDVSKEVFYKIDHHIWQAIWRWCCRRHPNKGKRWIKNKYFTYHKGDHWTFHNYDEHGNLIYLMKMGKVKIERHRKIRGNANPYDGSDEVYFEQRTQQHMLRRLRGKTVLRQLYNRQAGKCPLCQQAITAQSGWHIHHILPRYLGGQDTSDNLVLLHPTCHRQVHYAPQSVNTELLREHK